VEIDFFEGFSSKLIQQLLLRIFLESGFVGGFVVVVFLPVLATNDGSVFVVGTIVLTLFLGLSNTFLMIIVIVIVFLLVNVNFRGYHQILPRPSEFFHRPSRHR
jgi:hypothetical protein